LVLTDNNTHTAPPRSAPAHWASAAAAPAGPSRATWSTTFSPSTRSDTWSFGGVASGTGAFMPIGHPCSPPTTAMAAPRLPAPGRWARPRSTPGHFRAGRDRHPRHYDNCGQAETDRGGVLSDAHRKFFDLARLNKARIAIRRSSAWMLCSPLEREINGKTPQRAGASATNAVGHSACQA